VILRSDIRTTSDLPPRAERRACPPEAERNDSFNPTHDPFDGTFSARSLCQIGEPTKESGMNRLIFAGLLATAVASTAYSQATEYYVVQDTTTKKCTIVDKKPTTTTVTQVGPVAFKTRQEAESGMKTIKVCETK
jgi:hypothetical protein